MRFFELVSLILENLGRRKARVALTAVGVIIGTAAVVVLVSLAIGMQRSATAQLLNISELKQVRVDPGYIETSVQGIGGGGVVSSQGGIPGFIPITSQSLTQMAALPGVSQVIPRDYLQAGMTLRYDRMEAYTSIIGVGGIQDLTSLGYTAQAGELTLQRGQAVIGINIPQNFYDPRLRPGQEPPPPPDLVGQSIKAILYKYDQEGNEIRKTIQLQVTGMVSQTYSEPDWSIYVPLEDVVAWNEWATGRRVNRERDGYNSVIVLVEDVSQAVAVADAIQAMDFFAYTPQASVQGISNTFLIMQIVFGGIGAIALLVAAIGIANTMAMAILERTREIGLMKAVGATNRDVLSIFLGEAAGIGLIGGLGGVVIGWATGQIINVLALVYLAGQVSQPGMAMPALNVFTPPWLLGFALVFATLIGLLSGIFPALRAATLIPVQALKYE